MFKYSVVKNFNFLTVFVQSPYCFGTEYDLTLTVQKLTLDGWPVESVARLCAHLKGQSGGGGGNPSGLYSKSLKGLFFYVVGPEKL